MQLWDFKFINIYNTYDFESYRFTIFYKNTFVVELYIHFSYKEYHLIFLVICLIIFRI